MKFEIVNIGEVPIREKPLEHHKWNLLQDLKTKAPGEIGPIHRLALASLRKEKKIPRDISCNKKGALRYKGYLYKGEIIPLSKMYEHVEKLFPLFQPRVVEMMKLRFGPQILTHAAIARRFRLTRERVRQLIDFSLREYGFQSKIY